MIDRQSGPIGDQLEEVDVLWAKGTRLKRADVEHAEDAAFDEERHPQQRANPLLPQERVEGVGVIDVLDDDRPALGGDPPGKPAADGDADSPLDFLFETGGSPRDQFITF